MSDSTHYVICGGIEGRERLRVLSRVMQASSSALFDRLGLGDGMKCLDVGCGGGDVAIVQHVSTHGEAKLLNPLTMENIADAVLHDGLASRGEIDAVVLELYAFAARPDTLAGTPRVVQAWGRRR